MSKQEELIAAEKFMKDINTVFSQHYSYLISEATKRGILHRAQGGYAVTRPPLGYSTTETPGLFKLNRHGKAIRETLKKLVNGEMNIESATLSIALTFYGLCVIKSWDTMKTKRLMSNPYYAGYILYKGQLYHGLHEPLITKNEHKNLLAM